MKPLLIGQAPGPNTDPTRPLYPLPRSSAGGRLAEFMGLEPKLYNSIFDKVNLLNEFPGRGKRDDKFPLRDAMIAASAMRPLLKGRDVILIGRNVALAFGLQLEFHTWTDMFTPANWIAVVPHPSGRNHWYNSPENRVIAREFWKTLLRPHVPDTELLPCQFSRRISNASLVTATKEQSQDEQRHVPGHPVH